MVQKVSNEADQSKWPMYLKPLQVGWLSPQVQMQAALSVMKGRPRRPLSWMGQVSIGANQVEQMQYYEAHVQVSKAMHTIQAGCDKLYWLLWMNCDQHPMLYVCKAKKIASVPKYSVKTNHPPEQSKHQNPNPQKWQQAVPGNAMHEQARHQESLKKVQLLKEIPEMTQSQVSQVIPIHARFDPPPWIPEIHPKSAEVYMQVQE